MKLKVKPHVLAIVVASSFSGQTYAFTHTDTVDAGTTVNNETVTTGGDQIVDGTANNTTIESNAQQLVEDDGVTNGTIVNENGTQIVHGQANGTIVNDGGELENNGDVNNAVVNSGGVASINSGNSNDGQNDPTLGGEMTDTTLDGGTLKNRFGVDTNTVVNSGGVLETGTAEQGSKDTGTSVNATINSGGTQIIDNGGTSNGSTVNAGGTVIIQYDAHLNESGGPGTQSGTANDTLVYGQMENNGGTDNNTVVKSGGEYSATGNQTGQHFAISNDATIESGASATLNVNSQADNWTIAGTTLLTDDTATITNSAVNGGSLQINAGAATDTTLNGGAMENTGGSDTNTVVNNGGIYTLDETAPGTATAENLTINSGGSASILAGTVTDATVNGTMSIMQTTGNATLQGNVAVNSDGSLIIYNDVNTADADVTVTGGSVYLTSTASSSAMTQYQFGALTLDNGNVVFNDAGSNGYSSLTVDSLDGDGTFYMNTDLADLQGDLLNVTGDANGRYGVYVSDTGKSPGSDASLQIIQTGGGDANFSLANKGGVVDVGTYEYRLIDNGDNTWSLTPELLPPDNSGGTPAPAISPSTAGVLNMAAVDPLVFQAELGSVRHRLDETRAFSHDTNVWSDVYNTRNNAATDAGAGFTQTMSGMTLGIDKSTQSEHGTTTRGTFFSYSHSDVDFDRGGDGNVDSYSVGAYGSYLHTSGFYLDGILKANHFENDVNGRMTSGGAANGNYDTNGVGVHLQGGKFFYFGETYIAPYAAITGFTTDSSNYRLSNDMQAHVGNERSMMAEAGVNSGHQFTLKNGAVLQPYIGLAITQEFVDNNKVDVNDDGHFTNDLSGTRGVYQVGLRARLSNRLTAHVDASYAQGANVESPWVARAGVSWSF